MSALLLENGGYVLQEDGLSHVLLEFTANVFGRIRDKVLSRSKRSTITPNWF